MAFIEINNHKTLNALIMLMIEENKLITCTLRHLNTSVLLL